MFDSEPQSETMNGLKANNEGLKRRLANLKPARKGDPSRNPRGRPKKELDLAVLAQQHADLAIKTLALCLADETAQWPAKISAASELLDRGFGRAPASLDVKHTMSLSDEFEAFIRQLSGHKAPGMVLEVSGTVIDERAGIPETVISD